MWTLPCLRTPCRGITLSNTTLILIRILIIFGTQSSHGLAHVHATLSTRTRTLHTTHTQPNVLATQRYCTAHHNTSYLLVRCRSLISARDTAFNRCSSTALDIRPQHRAILCEPNRVKPSVDRSRNMYSARRVHLVSLLQHRFTHSLR